jgi:hypothetical protein
MKLEEIAYWIVKNVKDKDDEVLNIILSLDKAIGKRDANINHVFELKQMVDRYRECYEQVMDKCKELREELDKKKMNCN